MFAPPICRRRWSEQRFSVLPDPTKTAATERTSQRAERAIKQSAIRASGASKLLGARGHASRPRETTKSADLDVRAADLQEEMVRTTLFRSARSDEDGGNRANIAASGASNQTERDPRERSEQSNTAPGDGNAHQRQRTADNREGWRHLAEEEPAEQDSDRWDRECCDTQLPGRAAAERVRPG